MGRSRSFTAAQIERATRAARRVDPNAIIEVTRAGTIRILPADPAKQDLTEQQKRINDWFERDES